MHYSSGWVKTCLVTAAAAATTMVRVETDGQVKRERAGTRERVGERESESREKIRKPTISITNVRRAA